MLLKRLAILFLGLAFSAALTLADDKVKDDKTKKKVTVEPINLNISRKLDEKNFGFSSDATRVELLVSAPGKHFIGIDKASTLKTFADDKGNSLINEKDFARPNFNRYPRYSTDHSSMLVSVVSYTRAPGKGATKVLVKGELVAVCGIDEKSTEETKVEFKDKSETKIGDFTLRVNREKGFGGGGADFQISGTLRGIKAITVKGDDDKEVMVFTSGSATDFGGKHTYYYSLSKPARSGKVKITYFSKEETLKIPVDLAIGVGL